MNPADRETDRLLRQMELKIQKVYKQATDEVQEKLDDYLRRFEIKDRTWRQWVAEGKKTRAEYNEWRIGQIAIGERWEAVRDNLARTYANADKVARSIMFGYQPEVYAINHNWATYEVEHGLGVDTSYLLYDAQTVERLMKDDPQMLPGPGRAVSEQIRLGKAVRWNNQQIQSVMIQSILQGEAIPTIATRLAETVGDRDRKAAVRNARTMTTGAQNAGRVDGYRRCEDLGIELKQQWLATLDSRTRHSHRVLDGESVPVGEKFSNGCRFPGDPDGSPSEIYNCRCTLIAELKGFEKDLSDLSIRKDDKMAEQSYSAWKASHNITSNPILLPEEKANAFKWSYINEYRGLNSSSSRGIINRGMANGQRRSPFIELTPEDQKRIIEEAADIGIPEDILSFNTGHQTGFSDLKEIINVRGDVMPDLNSTNVRDRLSEKAVLAHEYYGHYKNHPSSFAIGDWRDEFRASYRAAIDTPNLSENDRRMLMLDAYDRAKEAGISVKYNIEARRIIYGYDE